MTSPNVAHCLRCGVQIGLANPANQAILCPLCAPSEGVGRSYLHVDPWDEPHTVRESVGLMSDVTVSNIRFGLSSLRLAIHEQEAAIESVRSAADIIEACLRAHEIDKQEGK